jgi:hypothetical protein
MPNQRTSFFFSLVALAGLVAVTACSTSPGGAPAAGGDVTIEGTIASIDTKPWTYDGHALVEVDVPAQGRVVVQLPARWNLCQAESVDVQALGVGMRVRAVGEAGDDGALTVCGRSTHRLLPL